MRPTLLKFFSTAKPMVNMKVEIDGQVTPFAFPLHSKLAKNLQKVGAPLDFQCGFACSCGTCPVKFTPQFYQKICKDQPMSDNEKKLLEENPDPENKRLSCQLFIMEYFQGITIKIE